MKKLNMTLLLLLASVLLLSGCIGDKYPSASEYCVDGTVPGSCSSSRPQYCTSEKVLIDEADLCGCPASMEPAGSVCVPD